MAPAGAPPPAQSLYEALELQPSATQEVRARPARCRLAWWSPRVARLPPVCMPLPEQLLSPARWARPNRGAAVGGRLFACH